MSRRFVSTALGAAVLLGAASPCTLAQSVPTTLGAFQAWTAATYSERSAKVCYMVSRPTDSQPQGVRRGDTYFMVTHKPAEGVRDEVSIAIGYPFPAGSAANIDIGPDSFALDTADEYAWPRTARSRSRLIDAMVRGREMVVRGVSRRGTNTVDRYSLVGFTAAHRAIDAACK